MEYGGTKETFRKTIFHKKAFIFKKVESFCRALDGVILAGK
jgi:hypothetical protein